VRVGERAEHRRHQVHERNVVERGEHEPQRVELHARALDDEPVFLTARVLRQRIIREEPLAQIRRMHRGEHNSGKSREPERERDEPQQREPPEGGERVAEPSDECETGALLKPRVRAFRDGDERRDEGDGRDQGRSHEYRGHQKRDHHDHSHAMHYPLRPAVDHPLRNPGLAHPGAEEPGPRIPVEPAEQRPQRDRARHRHDEHCEYPPMRSIVERACEREGNRGHAPGFSRAEAELRRAGSILGYNRSCRAWRSDVRDARQPRPAPHAFRWTAMTCPRR
jgi:hypothetical protein